MLAIIALGVIIIFNIWGKGLFKIIPILMGVIISYVFALIMNAAGITNPDGSTILDFTSIASSAWVGIPKFQFMKFDITSILVLALFIYSMILFHWGDEYVATKDMTYGMKFNTEAKALGFQDHDILVGTEKGEFKTFDGDMYRDISTASRVDIIPHSQQRFLNIAKKAQFSKVSQIIFYLIDFLYPDFLVSFFSYILISC